MKLCALLLAAMLCTLCVGQASALEYTMNAPDDYLFGRPTSDDTIYEWENPNVDRSKNTALIPPTFGSPTSYLPGTGTPLTPNLIPGALTGGGLVTQTGGVTYPTVGGSPGGNSGAGSAATGWTDVTGDLYYSGGHLGTLKSPPSACPPRCTRVRAAPSWRKGRATSRIPASGLEMCVSQATTVVSGMTSESCIRWSRGTPSPGKRNWGPGLIRSYR